MVLKPPTKLPENRLLLNILFVKRKPLYS
uniref:Uncharacterized protein n=1 Tax=Arundo donax TaxID=35708 RepID=A0A0A9C234_ARUDO